MIEELRALSLAGRVQEAEAVARRLLAESPTNGDAALHLVSALRWQRDPARYPEAMALGNALLRGLTAANHGELANELLYNMAGMSFELGLDAQGCRFQFKAVYSRTSPKIWAGQPLAGRTLLIVGDPKRDIAGELVPFGQVQQLEASRIVWRTRDLRWRALFERSDARVTVTGDESMTQQDFYVQHVDLMHLTLREGKLVRSARYLATDPAAVAAWSARLPPGMRIGLAWRGGQPGQGDYRTPPLECFGALAGIPATFVCLQYGDVTQDVKALRRMGLNLIRPSGFDPIASLDDAASVTESCDLVVTVDQSAAHIAGALGKPTCMLSAFYCHFTAYGPPGRSVFYPSLRVLTQPRLGEWGPVMAELRSTLLSHEKVMHARVCA